MRASPESPRMFDSDLLDALSRIPWFVVPILYGPITLGLFTFGVLGRGLSPLASLGLAAAGLLLWTLTEYGLHRTYFHWIPETSWGPRMHFIVHGVHHDWPDDRYRLVMPPAVSLLLLVLFYLLFWAILGPILVFPFLSGFVLGYMIYDCTHYAIHHYKPGQVGFAARVFKRLKAHHMNHHFNHPDRKFGVSTTLWDHIFRTY